MSRKRLASRALAALPLSFGLSLMGCSFAYCGEDTFARDRELRHGELAGTALVPGPDRKPAAFVQANVRGTSFVRRTNSEGRFVFSGLEEGPWMVTISEDDDGDGKPERRRVVSAVLRQVPHRTSPSFIPLLGGEGEVQLSGVDVGDVLLEGTVQVSGRVLVDGAGGALPPADRGLVAVVVAGRHLDLPRLESDGSDLVSLGAESKTGADYAGNFVLRNVSGGSFYLLVLLYEQGASAGQTGALLQVSEPVELRSGGENVVVGADIVLPDAAAPVRRPAQFVFSPPPSQAEEVYLILVPPGLEMPPCEDSPIDYSNTPFPYALTTAQRTAGSAPQFPDVPVGVWDMQACFTRSPAGTLFSQPIPPEVLDEAPVLLGPVLLTDVQACVASRPCDVDADCGAGLTCDEGAGRCQAPEGWSDCDGDGARGLPRITNDEERALWVSCADVCFASAGAAAADSSCEASDGNEYDCDDDGDGQPDVTESQACYGVGKGTDSDGDGICDGIDPFPECRANTAADCEAGAEPDVPTVPADYEDGDDEPALCAIERTYTPRIAEEFRFCEATSSAPDACPVKAMTCSFEGFLDESQMLAFNVCNSDGEGCAAGFTCVPELFDEELGMAPCRHDEPEPCFETCVSGYACRDVIVFEEPTTACVTDLAQLGGSITGELTCQCCLDAECGESRTLPIADYSTEGPIGLCSQREADDLFRRCSETDGTNDPALDAGPETDRADGGVSLPDGDADPCTLGPPAYRLVSTDADLLNLEGVLCLDPESGTLNLSNLPVAQLSLGAVEVVNGDVVLENTSNLVFIEAASLREIRGSLRLRNNVALEDVSVTFDGLTVEGDIEIYRHPAYQPARNWQFVPGAGLRLLSANLCSSQLDCFAPALTCGPVSEFSDASVCHQCLSLADCQEGLEVCDDATGPNGTYQCIGADGAGSPTP